MNNIARKLVLSALTVVLAVAALGTTTFAWFTLTNTASVQPFQAQIVTDTGIEVSIDEVTWYTTLTEATIEAYIATTAFSNFTHVTTATGLSGSFYTLGTGSLDPTTAGWLQIPLYFRSNSATAIDWTAVTLSSPVASWTSDANFVAANGSSILALGSVDIDASSSMRMSIQGSANVTTVPTSTVVVYEKPASTYNVVLGGDGVTPVDYSGTLSTGADGSYNYYYAKTNTLVTGTDLVVVAPTITTISTVRVTELADDLSYGTTYAGQIIIRIWLEGWDADAYNSILAREITAAFTFIGGTRA